MNDTNAALLKTHLETFVPLTIAEIQAGQRAMPDNLSDLATIIGGQGDAILYRIPGKTARVVGVLVEALAALAFAPGGVKFANLHFEATLPEKED